MKNILSIILSFLLLFLPGCRNTKTISSNTHFSDTTHIILVDTVNYEENNIKIVLTPKNDVDFSSSKELFQNINSNNYSVKKIELKKSLLEGSNQINVQTTRIIEKNARIEEKTQKTESKERTSLRFLFMIMILAVLLLFGFLLYDKIKFNDIRSISKEFEKYNVNKWTY